MAGSSRDPVAKAFGEILPKNPLNQLDDSDRRLLWALLMRYEHAATRRGRADAVFDELESATKTLADAARVTKRLELGVFQEPLLEHLRPFIVGFEDLPFRVTGLSKRLAALSKQLKKALNHFGKPGQKRKGFVSGFLIEASEFVRLKTGQHYDEQLAELFQAVAMRPESKDLSGDAIRKRRENLKEHYPVLYANALKRAKREHES
jgi:hypothetical protein